MKKYMILPSNTDLNRGDQALVWNTIELARQAGCEGVYYMLASDKALTKQSQSIGINILSPILKHPSRKFKTKNNIEYNTTLILKWGVVAIVDLFKSLLILSRFTRVLVLPLLSKEEKETLAVMKESEACFVKGGGFIHSAGKFTDLYTIYYQLFHIALAHSLGKPVYVMPNSFGPFHGFGVESMVRKVLKQCKLVTVRESISGKMLDEIGVDNYSFPDLGFVLNKSKKEYNEISVIREQHSNRKLVAITARPYRFPTSNNSAQKYRNYVQSMISFSKWLYSKNYLPAFVEHTLSETTHENDGSCIAEIVSKLSQGEYALVGDKDYTCRDLKAIYSEFDYVVGTRFHSVIFSLVEGVPSIAITYGGNKGQGIMRDIGLSDYAIPMSEFNTEKAILAFTKLCENREEVCSRLAKCKLQIEESYCQLVNKVKEKLA